MSNHLHILLCYYDQAYSLFEHQLLQKSGFIQLHIYF